MSLNCPKFTKAGLSVANLLTFLIMAILVSSQSYADNSQCWGMGNDDKNRPDIICKELTQKFILSFRNATKEEVIRRMTSPGQEIDGGIHYMSNADKYDGDINFYFINGKVKIITANVTENNYNLIWNEKENFLCSDFPSSINKC